MCALRAVPCLENCVMKLQCWQFCDVALSKSVTLVIPASKPWSRGKNKALNFETQQQPQEKKNGISVIYLKTLNNNNFSGLFQLDLMRCHCFGKIMALISNWSGLKQMGLKILFGEGLVVAKSGNFAQLLGTKVYQSQYNEMRQRLMRMFQRSRAYLILV